MTSLIAAAAPPIEQNEIQLHGWKLLSPLPDPIGFGGSFGGVLNGCLVVGGGSQFPNKPLWLNGEKVFSDRIFTLTSLTANWEEHSTRLPQKMGHFASATTQDAIYLAGGIDATGCLRQVLEIRAKGKDFVFTRLTDLPKPIGYAAAAIVGGRLYVVGGLSVPTSKTASVETWSLDISATGGKAEWKREADLPGNGVFVTAMAAKGKGVFTFGGIGFNDAEKPVPSKTVYRLDSTTGKWEQLIDLPEARVGAVTPCPIISRDKLFLVGGYAEVFPGALREHPGFSAQTYYFNLAQQRWETGPVLPRAKVTNRDSTGDTGPAPMIGAPGVIWQNHVVVVGGEVRSSVRTPAVVAWPLPGGKSSGEITTQRSSK